MIFIWRFIVKTTVGFTLLGLLIASAGILYLEPQLPPAAEIKNIDLQIPLRIYTKDGKLIGEFGEKRRTPITFEEVPPLFTKAMLAAEDDAFFEHSGIDIKSLVRAALQLVTTGRIQSGGSTITMQVAKNYFLTFDQTFTRKFTEILLAFKLENDLSKKEILELYVNKIYLGKRAYGIQAAAQIYYGKNIDTLNLAQLAMIAGLPKAPSAYNPIANPSRALTRRNWILSRMLTLGYIDTKQYDIAVAQVISAKFHGPVVELNAPYIAEMARQQLINKYGTKAYTRGYKVYTTVDSTLQAQATTALIEGLNNYDQRHGYRGPEEQLAPTYNTEQDHATWLQRLNQLKTVNGMQAAVVTAVEETKATVMLADTTELKLGWDVFKDIQNYINENRKSPKATSADNVVSVGDIIRLKQDENGIYQLSQIPEIQGAFVSLDSNSGAIKSLVGGYNFSRSKFNRVTQAKRQPGSNFKPFFYAYAMEKKFTPASLINDAPIVFKDQGLENLWRPDNSSGKFYGPTPIRKALYLSRNLVSIRLLQALGVSNVANYVERFGFNKKQLPLNLSLALGTQTSTPLQIASAYAILSNGGYKVEPYWVEQIIDGDDVEIFKAQPALACIDCITESVTETPDDLLEDEFEAIGFDELSLDATNSPQAEQVVDSRTIYLIDSILQDVVQRGTAVKAKSLGRNDLAGKTGTTNGPTDAWFSGYNSQLVATAWVGFDEYQELGNREYGGSAALPIWIDYMSVALEGTPDIPRKRPQGIVSALIDPSSGLRTRAGSAGAQFEIFREDNIPMLLQQNATVDDSNTINTGIDESGLF